MKSRRKVREGRTSHLKFGNSLSSVEMKKEMMPAIILLEFGGASSFCIGSLGPASGRKHPTTECVSLIRDSKQSSAQPRYLSSCSCLSVLI